MDKRKLWKSVWEWWKNIAQKIGNFQARLFLFIFYFVIVTPFALIIKFFTDPLKLKPKATSSFWLSLQSVEHDLEAAKRQG